MRQLVRGLVLAVLLLLAQQGALLHQLSHYASAATTQSDGDDGRHAVGGVCVGCVAYAEVGGAAVPSTAQPFLRGGLAFHLSAGSATPVPPIEAPPQRSRGPPTVL